eukprot:s1838_g28.t1
MWFLADPGCCRRSADVCGTSLLASSLTSLRHALALASWSDGPWQNGQNLLLVEALLEQFYKPVCSGERQVAVATGLLALATFDGNDAVQLVLAEWLPGQCGKDNKSELSS